MILQEGPQLQKQKKRFYLSTTAHSVYRPTLTFVNFHQGRPLSSADTLLQY